MKVSRTPLEILKKNTPNQKKYNHLRDDVKVKVEIALCAMKEQTKTCLSKPFEVYSDEISTLSKDSSGKSC